MLKISESRRVRRPGQKCISQTI